MNEEISLPMRARAYSAKDKKALLGEDVEIEDYTAETEEHDTLTTLTEISEEYGQDLRKVGIEPSERDRSGSFLQRDHSVLFSAVRYPGLEIMSTTDAVKKYDWLKEYLWKVVPVDTDKYTAEVALCQTHGYFIRVEAGSKVVMPLQACLFITSDKIRQNLHNIVIAEENSELHIITGCSVSHSVNSALHIGVSEMYVKKGAKITFTMVHNWGAGIEVRPRTAVVVEDDGLFVGNYILATPVKSLQMYPTVYCRGRNARTSSQSILYATGNANIDLGSRAVLEGIGSRAEIKSRVIVRDNARVIARGDLYGGARDAKGHIECRGLVLSNTSEIDSIPVLKAKRSDIDLSHEAAVGKVAEEEIHYLMARGLSEDEATSVIIRGFLNVEITGLPDALARETKKMLDMTLEKAM